MKKQTKIIVGIVLLISIIVVVAAFFYNSGPSKLAVGAIGKAEKYGKSNMTEADVQLRSEFTSDTIKLIRTINSLDYFIEFNNKTIGQIDTGLMNLRNHPILTDLAYNKSMNQLRDYSVFLANNTEKILLTKNVLSTFREGSGSADQSYDIEKNLRDLGAFIQQVTERDDVLESAALSIDKYIDVASGKKNNVEDYTPLKKFRDQLIVANLITAAMLGEKTTIGRLTKYVKTVSLDPQLVSAVNQLNISNNINAIRCADLQNFVGNLQGRGLCEIEVSM
jgi:hypothetical protein